MFARALAWRRTKPMQHKLLNIRFSSKTPPRHSPTDELGLPLSPPWSVHALINSYSSPTLPDSTLLKMYDSAALLPPAADTHEFREVKREMEDLVRLVEAVKMAPQEAMEGEGPADGRVWPSDKSVALEHVVEPDEALPSGRELLSYAQRTRNGYFLVDRAQAKT